VETHGDANIITTTRPQIRPRPFIASIHLTDKSATILIEKGNNFVRKRESQAFGLVAAFF